MAEHEHISCQEVVELVTDYLEDRLPPSERARFDAHLAACDGCAGYLEDIRTVSSVLGEAPAIPPDEHTREVLLRAFRDLRGSREG